MSRKNRIYGSELLTAMKSIVRAVHLIRRSTLAGLLLAVSALCCACGEARGGITQTEQNVRTAEMPPRVSIVTLQEESDSRAQIPSGLPGSGSDDTGKEENSWTDTGQEESSRTDTGQEESDRTDIGQDEDSRTGAGQEESGRTDIGQDEDSRTGAGQKEDGKTDTGQTEAVSADGAEDKNASQMTGTEKTGDRVTVRDIGSARTQTQQSSGNTHAQQQETAGGSISQQNAAETDQPVYPTDIGLAAARTHTTQQTQTAQQTGKKVLLEDFTVVSQYPELPTGCEMTSLAMTLMYHKLPVDKCDLADHYLDKGEVGTVDFHEAFEGDPRDEGSFGCYAPVVVKTANRYLEAQNSELKAADISGQPLRDLFVYIDAGVPLIIWGTRNCEKGHFSVTWHVNGRDIRWYTPEHCMVLVGYDDTHVWVADPLHGDIRSYETELFREGYDALYRQAVAIQ